MQELVYFKVGSVFFNVVLKEGRGQDGGISAVESCIEWDNARRIAVFSLGTLAAYDGCREEILDGKGINFVVRGVEDVAGMDDVGKKYAERLRSKMEGRTIS